MPSTGTDYDEKRNFIRMFVNADVQITDPATSGVYRGEGKNLSGDGAAFITNEKFNLNQRLNLSISSERSSVASLNAEFVVKRVDQLEDGSYEVAGTMIDVR
jgi:hypothetical protein